MIETLIHVIIVLLILGLLLWCVQSIPGIPAPILTAVRIIAVLIFVLWLLGDVGLINYGHLSLR